MAISLLIRAIKYVGALYLPGRHLYKFQDPIFERSAPKVTKLKDSDINISETDFSISEEDKRALKEAEALLNEPTISFDN